MNVNMNQKPITIVEHIIYKNKKIFIILSNGQWGIAKCNTKKGDIFDMDFGTQLAVARAYKNKELEKWLIENKYPTITFITSITSDDVICDRKE